MSQTLKKKYANDMGTDPQLNQIYEIISSLYDRFLDYYSGVSDDIQIVLESQSEVERLAGQDKIISELYIAVDKDDKHYEFVYCLDRLISELNLELNLMKNSGTNYVINDWTSILIHQIKILVDIFESTQVDEPVKIVKLTQPMSEILERERQSSVLSRVLRRFRAKKETAEIYEKYANRKTIKGIYENQVKPEKSNPAYRSAHLASATSYTSNHLR